MLMDCKKHKATGCIYDSEVQIKWENFF